MNTRKTIIKTLFFTCALAFADTTLCAEKQDINDKLITLSGTIDSINGELSDQRATIGAIKSQVEHSNNQLKRQMLEELKTLQRQNQYLYDTLLAQKERNGESMKIKPLRNYDLQTPDGKMILGEDEYVYVKEADSTIVARIDTGASQSSISASDIVEFERNSKKWLRFKIIHNDRTIEVEAPYVKQTKLRQSSIDGYSYRPVVKLNIKIGDFSTTAEFNLIDRTKMQYALLIGRNLLTDIAVVDVSRRYVQGRSDKTGLLIVCTDDYIEAVKNGINLNAEYDILQKLNKGGQIANKSTDGAESLGTNAQVALPSVNNQIEQKEGKKPALKLDKKQQKKKAAEKALQEEEENEASSLKANPFLNKKNNKK